MNVRIANDPIAQHRPNIAAPHISLTVGNTVTQLPALHKDTTTVRVATESASCRITLSSTNPSASLGELVPAGSTLLLSRMEAEQIKFIRTGSTDVTLQVIQFSTLS